MSFNIIDLVKDQISDQMMGQIGGLVGGDSAQTSSALGGALPGLLSGLVKSAGSSGGAGALFDAVQKQDDGMLGNMGALLGGNDSANVINQGTSMLGSLLGNGALGKLAGVLTGFSGLNSRGSSSLMGILAPIVIGVIKKKVFDGGLNAGGLASLLGDQQNNINAAMPQGFSSQLESSGFLDSIAAEPMAAMSTPDVKIPNVDMPDVKAPNVNMPDVSAPSGGGFMKWLLPLAAVVVLGWLGMKFFGNQGGDALDAAKGAADSATGAVSNVAESATDAASGAVESVAGAAGGLSAEALEKAKAAMPAGVNFDELSGNLNDVFGSTTETLSGITDAESATAALPALEEVSGKLGGLNDVMARLPDAAKGPLQSVVSGGLGSLQPVIDKVMGLPGIGPILEPVVGPMVEMLGGMAG